jgi:cell wall-associated NlpC family hydrolase
MAVRPLVPLLVIAAFAAGCAARPARVLPPAPPPGRAPLTVSVASSLIGVPYRNGGTTPDGFDCSGFTQYVLGQAGFRLPRSVQDQFAAGEAVDRDHVRAGDLVFFAIDGRTVSHVGLAVGRDRFVHAPSSRGFVREESLLVSYWESRFAGARRVAGR